MRFPVKFAKLLRTPIFTKNLSWLVLKKIFRRVATSEIVRNIFWKMFMKMCYLCSINVLFINVQCFIYENVTFITDSFVLFTDWSIFLFVITYNLKCLNLKPCIIKRNHMWKYHLIFFFCNFIIDFLFFGSCYTKGAAQQCKKINI